MDTRSMRIACTYRQFSSKLVPFSEKYFFKYYLLEVLLLDSSPPAKCPDWAAETMAASLECHRIQQEIHGRLKPGGASRSEGGTG